jgi:hypothetical protein
MKLGAEKSGLIIKTAEPLCISLHRYIRQHALSGLAQCGFVPRSTEGESCRYCAGSRDPTILPVN